jgi:hypothetical protein
MKCKRIWKFALMAGLTLASTNCVARAESNIVSKKGKVDIQSAGPLAFGPNDMIFVGDPQVAAIIEIVTRTSSQTLPVTEIKLPGIDQKIAVLLKTTASEIVVNDLKVQPSTGVVYLSISAGGRPAIVRVDGKGKLTQMSLDNAEHSKLLIRDLSSPVDNDQNGGQLRTESITDLAFISGRLLVAGLSNSKGTSTLITIPYPFQENVTGTSVLIDHDAGGQFETDATLQTFVPANIAGKPHILAAYSNNSLVKAPLDKWSSGDRIRGVTVAELGNQNLPRDMIEYRKNGRHNLLLANSGGGLLKLSTDDFRNQTSISGKVSDTPGVQIESIPGLTDVEQLDKLDEALAIVLIRTESSGLSLETIPLP